MVFLGDPGNWCLGNNFKDHQNWKALLNLRKEDISKKLVLKKEVTNHQKWANQLKWTLNLALHVSIVGWQKRSLLELSKNKMHTYSSPDFFPHHLTQTEI